MKSMNQIDWRAALPPEAIAHYEAELKKRWETINPQIAQSLPERPPVQCDGCNDLGLIRYDVPTDDPRFGKMFACPDCRKGQDTELQRTHNRIRTAELPDKYQRLTFETWDALPDYETHNKMLGYLAAKEFVQNPGHMVNLYDLYVQIEKPWEDWRDNRPKNSLVFWGDLGTGKTGLAAAIMNKLIEQGTTPLYIRARDLIREVQRRYGKDVEPSADDILRKFQLAPVLMIDEFTVENATSDRLEIIEDVIRFRYGRQLPTIITTNHDQISFEDKWGGRTSDPIKAMAHWIHVGLPALRKTDAEVYEWQERFER